MKFFKGGIDPIWITILTIVVQFDQNVGAGKVSLDHVVPGSWIPWIVGWCGFLAIFLGYVVGGMTLLISNKPGLLIAPVTAVTKAMVLLAVLVIGSFAFAGDARAAQLPRPRPATFDPIAKIKTDLGIPASGPLTQTNGQPCDPANLLPGCAAAATQSSLNNLKQIITKPLQDFANFISAGIGDAATLSVAIANLQDGNGQACWLKLQSAGQVFQAHPVPVTFNGAVDLEAIRLLHMTAAAVCQYSPCTQVFDEAAGVVAAAAPLKTPIPSMHDLCANIPPIAVVAPFVTATPVPTVTPQLGAFAPSVSSTPTPIPAAVPTPAPSASPTPTPTPVPSP